MKVMNSVLLSCSKLTSKVDVSVQRDVELSNKEHKEYMQHKRFIESCYLIVSLGNIYFGPLLAFP